MTPRLHRAAALSIALALFGCQTSRQALPVVIAETNDSTPAPAPTPVNTQAPSAAPAVLVAPPPELPPFDQPILERSVFRFVAVGALVYYGRRLTWTLERGATKARIGVTCQTALSRKRPQLGISLDGEEMIEDLWSPAGEAEIRGDVVSQAPLRMRFTVAQTTLNETCGKLVSSFELSCKRGHALVRPAGAKLVVGSKPPGAEIPSHRWQPASREMVNGLSCEAVVSEETRSIHPIVWPTWRLFFTQGKGSSPGVEWAHENSDMVVQDGDFRWMPARR